MKKYNILYFLDYGNGYGGAVNTIVQQAVIMKNKGHHITLCISDYLHNMMADEYKDIINSLNLKVTYATFQICSHTEDIDVAAIVENYDSIKKKIQEICPDIIHSVQINPIVELVSRELNIPHIMNIYPLLDDFFGINYINIFPYYHTCDSNYWIVRWKKYLDLKSVCIRTVVEAKYTNKGYIDEKNLKFVCVGNIYKEKNQLSVIKSFERFLNTEKDAQLFIYGYKIGVYAEECAKYIEQNGISNNVHLMGFCSDKKEIYRDKDAIICGSTRESYPNVISESLCNGLTVISTPVGGVPEVIKDEYNGYIASGFTEEAIYNKILQYYNDIKKGAIAEIQYHAKETFHRTHTEDAIFLQLEKFYEDVLKENKHSSKIGINNIRDNFGKWIDLYYSNVDYWDKPDLVKTKIWYIAHISSIIEQAKLDTKCFYVWGAGNLMINTLQIINVFFSEIKLSGIIDSRKEGEVQGYKLFKPEQVLDKMDNVIFISVDNGQEDIIDCLKTSGRVYGKDFFLLANRRW